MNVEQTPPSYESLMAENIRLKAVRPVGKKATLFVVSVVILCMLTVTFVILITFLRPIQDNTAIILTIIGVIAPVITALLAAAIQQVHLASNSRLSQLLELTAKASKAEGALASNEPPMK